MVTIEATAVDAIERTIDRFWEAIPPVWHAARCNLRGIAADQFGISVEQFHILRHIRRGRGSVSELAEAKQISRSAISQAVDTLVEKGLIARQQDPIDRRVVHLALTPDGSQMLNALFDRNRAWMREKLARLSPAELDSLMKSMEILKQTFEGLSS